MKVTDAYPSPYLKASDLEGKAVTVIIDGITRKDFAKPGEMPDVKSILSMENRTKMLVLNKTNSFTIAEGLGMDEMDDWVGEEIELYPDRVNMNGKVVPCIRVRMPLLAADGDVPF